MQELPGRSENGSETICTQRAAEILHADPDPGNGHGSCPIVGAIAVVKPDGLDLECGGVFGGSGGYQDGRWKMEDLRFKF